MMSGVSLTVEQDEPTFGGGSNPTTPLHKSDYWIRDVQLQTAQEITERFHYSQGGSNTGTFCHGLFQRDRQVFEADCLGVAWWLPPTKSAAIASYDGDWRKVLSLSRLAVLPGVPTNAASYLLTHSVRKIKRDGRFEFLVTYADTWRGHTGAIYRAAGWTYAGMTKPEAVWVDSSGRMVCRKAGPRTRTKREMESLGYKCVGKFPKHKYIMRIAWLPF